MGNNRERCRYVTYMATSCTREEAVKIMLGLLSEPHKWIYEGDDENYFDPTLSLMEELEEHINDAITHYDDAIEGRLSSDVLDNKKSEVAKRHEMKRLAKAYLCHIDNELAKGEESDLIKTQFENNGLVESKITLHSLDSWSRKHYQIPIIQTSSANQNGLPTTVATTPTKYPRTKMLEQEDAILAEIWRRGVDPKAMPMYQHDKAGIKSDVQSTLAKNSLFKSSTAFKRAWERLRQKKLVTYVK